MKFTIAILAAALGAQATSHRVAAKDGQITENTTAQNPSVEGVPHFQGNMRFMTHGYCPRDHPMACPDGVNCCRDGFPWCCPTFCCPDEYAYCGMDGRCYAS